MAKVKYFSGDVELDRIQGMPMKEFAAKFPGVKGRRRDSFDLLVGQPLDFKPVWAGDHWTKDLHPVDRVVTYKSNPSKHPCDARCVNASGRVMNCECSCGGKNHGKGRSLVCAAVAG